MKRNLPKLDNVHPRRSRRERLAPTGELLGELPGMHSAGGAREGRHADSWLCAASGRH